MFFAQLGGQFLMIKSLSMFSDDNLTEDFDVDTR